MEREKYINDISEYISTIQYHLNNVNKIGLNDINRHLEITFIPILNTTYDYNLINLNVVHPGEAGIDLIDDENKVCIQVTSTNTSTKIRHTIATLKNSERELEGYRLRFLIFKNPQKHLANYETDVPFSFDPQNDIIEISSLLNTISGLDISKLKKILSVLRKEMGKTFYRINADDIEKIINLSSNFIKDRTLKYLCNSTKEDLFDIVMNFDSVKASQEWKNLSDVFATYVNSSKVSKSGNSERYNYEECIFDTLCSKIKAYKKNNDKICMIIKGDYRTGKSMFTSLLYLNLINDFLNERYDKIPVYINLERISSQDLSKEFNNTMDQAKELQIKNTPKICLILDGVPQYLFNHPRRNNNIEKIYTTLTGNQYSNVIDSLVLCIDTNNKLSYGFSTFITSLKTDNIIYIDQVTIQNQLKSSRDEEFIKAFCRLEHKTEATQTVIKHVNELRLKYIDFCILTTLKEELFSSANINLSEELEHKITSKLEGSTANLTMASKIAYMIYYNHNSIESIQSTFCSSHDYAVISSTINLVLCFEIYAQYLLAVNYIDSMRSVLDGDNAISSISNREVLNRLYGDEICSYIIGYIQFHNYDDDVLQFCSEWFDKLSFSGQSMCLYILGRLHNGRNLTKDRLTVLETSIDNNYSKLEKPSNEEFYTYCVAKRSLTISRIRGDNAYHDNNNYILQLLRDKTARKINRDFYLEYYGDRIVSDKVYDSNQDIILKGLDFFKTYQILASGLTKYKETKIEYPLFRLELFTLCDLIQTRLDQKYITHKRLLNDLQPINEKTSEYLSFFYNASYNSDSNNTAVIVIDFIISVLDIYVRKNKNHLNTDIFIQYLRYELNIFESVKDKLIKHLDDFSFEYTNLLSVMSELPNIRRIGWNIKTDIDNIEQDEIDDINDKEPVLENVLQHTYEMFLIALLYLPESSNTEGYDKQKVLNLIWIHDLGEAIIKDYPPFFSGFKDKKNEERIVCQKYYLAGMHPQYATMVDYLNGSITFSVCLMATGYVRHS